jgi:L-lactate utilization protein LutC
MQQITPREQILKNIRAASVNKNDEIFQSTKKTDVKSSQTANKADDLDIQFAKELNDNGGNFIYCLNQNELSIALVNLVKENKWTKIVTSNNNLFKYIDALGLNPVENNLYDKNEIVFISDCDYLISDSGSVMLSSKIFKNTKHNHLNDVMLIIAERNQIEPNLASAFEKIKSKYKSLPSKISLISGSNITETQNFSEDFNRQQTNKIFVFLLE